MRLPRLETSGLENGFRIRIVSGAVARAGDLRLGEGRYVLAVEGVVEHDEVRVREGRIGRRAAAERVLRRRVHDADGRRLS